MRGARTGDEPVSDLEEFVTMLLGVIWACSAPIAFAFGASPVGIITAFGAAAAVLFGWIGTVMWLGGLT